MIEGHNLIGHKCSSMGSKSFLGMDPSTGKTLDIKFFGATKEEVNTAMNLSNCAFQDYRNSEDSLRASFLQEIIVQIEDIAEALIICTCMETALPRARVENELNRTIDQINQFKTLLEEGTWKFSSSTVTKIQKYLVPLGPVVVFGAGNFPLAFSTAGTDTISALATGNTVVVKAHPDHPGTSALVGKAILKACKNLDLPEGLFSLLYDKGHHVGRLLVLHPLTKAVGFTGSQKGGRALLDLAAERQLPIPVFAEMGSINPIIILPSAMGKCLENVAETIFQSITMGAGQFCTNPGLLLISECTHSEHFIACLRQKFESAVPRDMLSKGVYQNYIDKVNKAVQHPDIIVSYNKEIQLISSYKAIPVLGEISRNSFGKSDELQEELFGPFSLIVRCKNANEIESVLSELSGQLTTSIFGENDEVSASPSLIQAMAQISGRVIFNEAPTGVQVTKSMHHGGPYPASTDARFTSVGTDAILRFVRPVCYQNFPHELLPIALHQ